MYHNPMQTNMMPQQMMNPQMQQQQMYQQQMMQQRMMQQQMYAQPMMSQMQQPMYPQQQQMQPGYHMTSNGTGASYPNDFSQVSGLPVQSVEAMLTTQMQAEIQHLNNTGTGARFFNAQELMVGVSSPTFTQVMKEARDIMIFLMMRDRNPNAVNNTIANAVNTALYGRIANIVGGPQSPVLAQTSMMLNRDLGNHLADYSNYLADPNWLNNQLMVLRRNTTNQQVQATVTQNNYYQPPARGTVSAIGSVVDEEDPVEMMARIRAEANATAQTGIVKQNLGGVGAVQSKPEPISPTTVVGGVARAYVDDNDVVHLPDYIDLDNINDYVTINNPHDAQKIFAAIDEREAKRKQDQVQQVVEEPIVATAAVGDNLSALAEANSRLRDKANAWLANAGKSSTNLEQYRTTDLSEPEETTVDLQAPESHYHAGVASTSAEHDVDYMQPTSNSTFDNEMDDADFANQVFDAEALQAAYEENRDAAEYLTQKHGDIGSISEAADKYYEDNPDVVREEPVLRLPFFAMPLEARRHTTKTQRITSIPAYIKGKHNLIYTSQGGGKVELVELEGEPDVEYEKHEAYCYKFRADQHASGGEYAAKLMEDVAKSKWDEEFFMQQLNQRLENSKEEDIDLELTALLSERNLIVLDRVVFSSGGDDTIGTDLARELESIEDLPTDTVIEDILDHATVAFKRTKPSGISSDVAEIVTDLKELTDYEDIVKAVKFLADGIRPTREAGRILEHFTLYVNRMLNIKMGNGWSVDDAIADASELCGLIMSHTFISAEETQDIMSDIYSSAVKLVFGNEHCDQSEYVILAPFTFAEYPLAGADKVSKVHREHHPELVGLLTKSVFEYLDDTLSGDDVTQIKLVSSDNVTWTFITHDYNFYLVDSTEPMAPIKA